MCCISVQESFGSKNLPSTVSFLIGQTHGSDLKDKPKKAVMYAGLNNDKIKIFIDDKSFYTFYLVQYTIIVIEYLTLKSLIQQY